MKERLRELLERGDFGEIAADAAGRKRVLGALVSLTYDRDPLVAWRAVEAMGAAADRIARQDPEFVRGHLRRLHWLLSEESGGFCLHAAPAMAEIVRRRPDRFSGYAGIVCSLLDSMAEEDLSRFRPGILWGIGRLASVAPKEVEAALPRVRACLHDPDPQVRGLAVWCLGQAGRLDRLEDRAALLADEGPVEIYEGGRLAETSVSALVRR